MKHSRSITPMIRMAVFLSGTFLLTVSVKAQTGATPQPAPSAQPAPATQPSRSVTTAGADGKVYVVPETKAYPAKGAGAEAKPSATPAAAPAASPKKENYSASPR